MAIQQGVSKQSIYKRQTAKGTLAGATGGQILRRASSTFELAKETYTTENEMTSTQQLTSVRHGARLVNGKVNGNLSPGTYSDMLSAVLRRDFAAVSAIAGASITIAGTAGAYTITRAAGSYLTDGIKNGMVVRLTAGTFNAANLNKNLFVTGVTDLVLTVAVLNGSTLTAEGPIAAATVSVPGKVTYVPATGHTNIYYTEEEWHPTISISEYHQDVKFVSADISLPGSGNATIDLTAMGLAQTRAATAYFTTPTAETSTDPVVAASGVLMVNGVSQAVVTDLKITIDGKGQAADPAVGSNTRVDIFNGKLGVTGSFTAYFDSATISDLFTNETSIAILSALTSAETAAADFITFAMTAVKLTNATPEDQETGLKRSYNFTATYNSAGGAALANHASTIMCQDSKAA